jgi:hypothetical protein
MVMLVVLVSGRAGKSGREFGDIGSRARLKTCRENQWQILQAFPGAINVDNDKEVGRSNLCDTITHLELVTVLFSLCSTTREFLKFPLSTHSYPSVLRHIQKIECLVR